MGDLQLTTTNWLQYQMLSLVSKCESFTSVNISLGRRFNALCVKERQILIHAKEGCERLISSVLKSTDASYSITR